MKRFTPERCRLATGLCCRNAERCGGLARWRFPRPEFPFRVCRVIKPESSFLGSSMVEHSAVNRRAAGSSPARGANSFISADLVLAARRLPFWGPFGRPPKEPVGRPGTRRNKLARHCSAHRCFHVFHDGGLREISLSCCGYMRASACLGNSKSRQKTGRSSCRSEKSKILLTPSPRVSTIFWEFLSAY